MRLDLPMHQVGVAIRNRHFQYNFQLYKDAQKCITSSKFKLLQFSLVHPKPKFKHIIGFLIVLNLNLFHNSFSNVKRKTGLGVTVITRSSLMHDVITVKFVEERRVMPHFWLDERLGPLDFFCLSFSFSCNSFSFSFFFSSLASLYFQTGGSR